MNKFKQAFIECSDDQFLFDEINYHPLISYAITLCNEVSEKVFVVSPNKDLGDLCYKYGAELIKSIDQVMVADEVPFLIVDAHFPLYGYSQLEELSKAFISSQRNYASDGVATISRDLNKLMVDRLSMDRKQLRVLSGQDIIAADALIKRGFGEVHPVIINSNYIIRKLNNKSAPKLLFSAPYEFFPKELKYYIAEKYDVTYAFNAPASEVLKLLPDIDIWITGTCPPYFISKELIQQAKNIKIIATPSTGTNHIDTEYAASKNIPVLSIKSSKVIEKIYASSEFSFSLLLAMVNKILPSCNAAKMGVWREREHEFRSIELNGKTLGLIGYGRIGKKMARFAESFEMEVIAFDPYKRIKEPFVTQVNSREELLQNSDIVSLHYHLTPDTRNSFTAVDFNLMKMGAYFLNTARGELVNELDMIEALKTGRLRAAAVDVISDEHIQEKWDHPVIKYARENENLLVSPHIAGCTVDSESKAAKDLLDQVAVTWGNLNMNF